jgi:hypothetical protein
MNMAGMPSGAPTTKDIKMRSWAKERYYQLDFGGAALGKPTAVRGTRFEGWDRWDEPL